MSPKIFPEYLGIWEIPQKFLKYLGIWEIPQMSGHLGNYPNAWVSWKFLVI